eukprot:g13100.t1
MGTGRVSPVGGPSTGGEDPRPRWGEAQVPGSEGAPGGGRGCGRGGGVPENPEEGPSSGLTPAVYNPFEVPSSDQSTDTDSATSRRGSLGAEEGSSGEGS